MSAGVPAIPARVYTQMGEAIQAYEPEAVALLARSPAALLQVLLEAGRRAVAAAVTEIRSDEQARVVLDSLGGVAVSAGVPAEAITAATDAIHFWHAAPAAEERRCNCLPEHPTARYDQDRGRAIRALEAAAPAIAAQAAAAEREACAKLAEGHSNYPSWAHAENGDTALRKFAWLLRERAS